MPLAAASLERVIDGLPPALVGLQVPRQVEGMGCHKLGRVNHDDACIVVAIRSVWRAGVSGPLNLAHFDERLHRRMQPRHAIDQRVMDLWPGCVG
jgi:hypothetical protein